MKVAPPKGEGRESHHEHCVVVLCVSVCTCGVRVGVRRARASVCEQSVYEQSVC